MCPKSRTLAPFHSREERMGRRVVAEVDKRKMKGREGGVPLIRIF